MIWHKMRVKEAIKCLETSEITGLSQQEATLRTSKYGKNQLDKAKKNSFFKRFVSQLNDYMIIILIIAAIVSYGVSVFEGAPDLTEPLIILAIVLLNAIIGVIQETKAEKAIEALNKLSAFKANVIREGQVINIDCEDVTIGDIILLKAGDKVPADARIIEDNMLRTDESAITGEAMAVNKASKKIDEDNITIADMNNMLWSSSLIVSGTCKAVVTDIGMDTQVGKIAGLINKTTAKKTPLQEKLASTGQVLGIGAILICLFIFIVGVLNKQNLFDMFMTSVSLAVAAIPEGLPVIVTVVLAVGVRKMAQKNAVVRKLPAVETLGCSNIICTDKTGTLTKNKMTVEKLYGNRQDVLTLAVLCNDNSDPTEKAIIECADKDLIKYKALNEIHKRISCLPFNSNEKCMITLNRFNGGYRQIIKGAPDIILKKCNVSYSDKTKILEYMENMASDALRVIAVGYCDTTNNKIDCNAKYNFSGLIGISDPLRPEVKKAVQTCKKAGIKPVMITGDHKITAEAIAKNAGIFVNGSKTITGDELNVLSDKELEKKISNVAVFARVTPQHKVRIVKAFQNLGYVTAMTGDGVNDAPALKQADIGCSMGSGTEVAKCASDIVLTDDNFATIVEAVKQGRNIYANIKKTVHFLISSNIGEIITILTAVLMKLPTPLTAIQLLWVNLITDSLPAIALGMDSNEKELMSEPPLSKKNSIFSGGMIYNIIFEGLMISGLAIYTYIYAQNTFNNLSVARTMTFCVLALSQLVHSLNLYSEKSIIFGGIIKNRLLIFSFILGWALQLVMVTTPVIAQLFDMSLLNGLQIRFIALVSMVPLGIFECAKLFDMLFKK